MYKRGQVGGHLWSTLITGCFLPYPELQLPRQVVLQFTGGTGGAYLVVRAMNPGGCLALNLATDPDMSGLPDGTYAVTVTTLGGFFVSGLSYTLTGQAAQITNGVVPGAPTVTPTLVGSTAIPTPTPGIPTSTLIPGPYARRLEAVVSGIARSPDTSYTGVWFDTKELRVTNTGPLRTIVSVEWFSTSSDSVGSLVRTDSIEVAGTSFPDPIHRTAVFGSNLIPFGCTRCQALIYSLDLDGNDPLNGIFDLTATVTHRVVDAGNALATGTAPLLEEIIPAGPNAPSSWVLPVVYKRAPVGALAISISASSSVVFLLSV